MAVVEETIPVIDISRLGGSDAVASQHVAEQLCAAAAKPGFFYISNHGVSRVQIDAAFATAKEFFAASDELKQSVAVSPHHRGWLEVGRAKMYGSTESDQKESFVWGLDIADDDPDYLAGNRLLAPNQWPEFLPGMRETLVRYFAATQACGEKVLRGFANGLGIDAEYFSGQFTRPVSRASLIYYPPAQRTAGSFGAAPHTDYGTLTLLAQNDIGGLEVKAKSGKWIKAEPIADTFVVNVGDLLARWSNGRFESTQHRVINPAGGARYSVAMFVDPDWDSLVIPVARNGESAAHAPVRCAEYIYQRYDEAFAYRGAQAGKSGAGDVG